MADKKMELVKRLPEAYNTLAAAQGPEVAEKMFIRFQTLVDYGIGGDKENAVEEARKELKGA